MNNRLRRQFVEELLNQMPQLTSGQYRIYRRELDEKLARARHQEKSMRWIVIGAWLATLAIYICAALLLYRFEPSARPPSPEWLPLACATGVLLLPLAALLLLGLYLFKYRRRVNRARAEAHQAALGELQRQLNELRSLLPPAQESPSSSTPSK